MNTKQKGNIGLGAAIAYFLLNGIAVALPINDSQPYDLIVDLPESGLSKIEIKTTFAKSKNSDNFIVDLRTTGGNQSRNYAKDFDKSACDFVFVYAVNGDYYLIPSSECKNSITLSGKYLKYKKSAW